MPIDQFLEPLKGTIYYEPLLLALTTSDHLKTIASDLGISEKAIQHRLLFGSAKLGIAGGRSGLEKEYIFFLEDWITMKGMK